MYILRLLGNYPVSSLSLQSLKWLCSSCTTEAWVLNSPPEAPTTPSRAFQNASPQGLESVLSKILNVYQAFSSNRYKSSVRDTSYKYKTRLSLGINCNSLQLNFFWNNWHCLQSEIGHWTRTNTNVIWYRLPGPGHPPARMACLESWLTSCLTRILLFKGCPKPKPYMAQVDVSGDTCQWQSRAAPGSLLQLLLTAPQKPQNHLWLTGIQSQSKLSVSAGQHPAAVDPGASQVPWILCVSCAPARLPKWLMGCCVGFQ